MVENAMRFNPETGKPTPVSLREFMLMDRHEKRSFMIPLTRKEQKDFQLAVVVKQGQTPLAEIRTYIKEFAAKLEKRENRSLGDKLELALAKMRAAQYSLPEKQPIFLRKLRIKEIAWPKWLTEKKSPYLIAPSKPI